MTMTQNTMATGLNQESFDAFMASRDEPAWLTDIRHGAWKHYCQMPMPSQRDEEWMRTDIRLLRLDRFTLAEEPADETLPPAVLGGDIATSGTLATKDSHPITSEFDPGLSSQGVLFGHLEELLRSHGDLLKPHLFTRAVDPAYDKFSALHAAFWSGGTLLYVPRGVTIADPLCTLAALSEGQVDLGHTLVVMEEGAEASLLSESHSMPGAESGLHCGAVEMLLAPGSRLRYVNLQDWGSGVWHFSHQKAIVDRDAALQWTIGALGSRLAKVNQHVALTGSGADAQVNGVMFSEGRQHLCYHTLQHHEAPGCHSDLLYKCALQDQSRIVWRGMIKGDPLAQKTDGYQRNDNLILDPNARADSIPGLEIEADDVRCTHGATSGRVDDEMIYYCETRGLSREEAVRLIVSGFFQQISDRISLENVRVALGDAIGQRIREYE